MIELCVRGYNICKDIWEPDIWGELLCERETSNTKDKYAVAVSVIRKFRARNIRGPASTANTAKISTPRI